MRRALAVVVFLAAFHTPVSWSLAADKNSKPSATVPFQAETLADIKQRETIYIDFANAFLRMHPDCVEMRFERQDCLGIAVLVIRCRALRDSN